MTAEELAAPHLVAICQNHDLLFTPCYFAAITGDTKTFTQEVQKLDEDTQLKVSAELNRRAAEIEAELIEMYYER